MKRINILLIFLILFPYFAISKDCDGDESQECQYLEDFKEELEVISDAKDSESSDQCYNQEEDEEIFELPDEYFVYSFITFYLGCSFWILCFLAIISCCHRSTTEKTKRA